MLDIIGVTVLDAGGSGGLTLALAQHAMPGGRVVSYEVRPDMQNLVKKNLDRAGVLDRVELKLKDIAEGFDETGADWLSSMCRSRRNIWARCRRRYDPAVTLYAVLTTNQISRILERISAYPFGLIEAES